VLLFDEKEDSVIDEICQARFNSARAAANKERWKTLTDLFLESYVPTYASSAEVGSGRFGKQGFVVGVKKS
jgi:hypothetical protein